AGLAAGDRVAFLDKNNPACLETTLACSLLGAANAVVNYRLAPAEVAYIVNDAQAKILFVGAEFVPVIHGIRDQLAIERVIVGGGEGDQFEDFLAKGSAELSAHPAEPDDCFLQLYTSGTTGFPNGAMLTHRSLR